MNQKDLNLAMSVPLRQLALTPGLQEAVRHNPDLKKIQELVLRQASMLATGNIDEKLGQEMASQYLDLHAMMPDLYAPLFGVIEDIIKTYGPDKGNTIIQRRASQMTRMMYSHLIEAVVKTKK